LEYHIDMHCLPTRRSSDLNSDITLLLCIANMLYNFQAKEFVTSIDTSMSIQNFVKNHGCYLTYSKVGEANVVQKMIEKNANAGGDRKSTRLNSSHVKISYA